MRSEELASSGSGIEGLGSDTIYVYLAGAAGPRGLEFDCPVATQPGWASEQVAANADFTFIRSMRTALDQRVCMNPDRVGGYARSMGGALLHAFAGANPGFFRAIGSVVAVYRTATVWSAPVPAIVTGNAADDVAQIGGVPAYLFARDALITLNGCSNPVQNPVFADCVTYTCANAPLRACTSVPGNSHTPSATSRNAVVEFFTGFGF
jgi:hypothetical protein